MRPGARLRAGQKAQRRRDPQHQRRPEHQRQPQPHIAAVVGHLGVLDPGEPEAQVVDQLGPVGQQQEPRRQPDRNHRRGGPRERDRRGGQAREADPLAAQPHRREQGPGRDHDHQREQQPAAGRVGDQPRPLRDPERTERGEQGQLDRGARPRISVLASLGGSGRRLARGWSGVRRWATTRSDLTWRGRGDAGHPTLPSARRGRLPNSRPSQPATVNAALPPVPETGATT